MKKFCVLILWLLVLLCFASCDSISNRATLMGTVVEIYDASLFVETDIGPCIVSMPHEMTKENCDIAVGDLVEIIHSGEIAESYPMQIHHVYAIKRVGATQP